MPDARLEQARKTLPHGYQFGDGRFLTIRELAAAHFIERWHARHSLNTFVTPTWLTAGDVDRMRKAKTW